MKITDISANQNQELEDLLDNEASSIVGGTEYGSTPPTPGERNGSSNGCPGKIIPGSVGDPLSCASNYYLYIK